MMRVSDGHAAALKAAIALPSEMLAVMELWMAGELSKENADATANQMQARLKLINDFAATLGALPYYDWRHEK